MAKYRMVPDGGAEEARYIHELIAADIAAKLPELNKDLKLLRKRLMYVEHWEEIANDLTEEERAEAEDRGHLPTAPAKPQPANKPRTSAPPDKIDSKNA